MRALRKGQSRAFDSSNVILGEARIAGRAFGIGQCVLAEAVTMLKTHFQDVKAKAGARVEVCSNSKMTTEPSRV